MVSEAKIFNKNLLIRTITALTLAPLVLAIIFMGGIAFKGLIVVSAVLMAFEWNTITSHDKSNHRTLIWKISGVIYILLPCISLLWIADKQRGHEIVAWLMIAVWLVDISAFFTGKIIGGPKLMPRISPNKTWSGFMGAMIMSYFFGLASVKYFEPTTPSALIMLTIVVAFFAQVGDFLESWIKRKFGIKDTGKIVPGHGGFLDRVDSLVITATKVAFAVTFYKETFL